MKTVGDVQFISLSEAKSILPTIVDDLRGPTVLVRHSEPVAALVSIEKYNEYLAFEKLIRHPEEFDRLRALAKQAARIPIKDLGTMEDLEALHERLHKTPATSRAEKRTAKR